MYPVWEVPFLGPGIVLAIIAVFHILPSHLSVSAMWFNLYFESIAVKQNKPELFQFIKKFTLLLLIFAYVFGSLSGVGIWFATTVASPRGISALIHNYVWAWASEWIFFIIEVTCIFVYYYTIDKVDQRTHLKLGWIFALASFPTMMIIVGIISFMLTPGKWIETGSFLDGFYNPSYFTQLGVRTGFMFVIGAVYAIAVGSRIKNLETRRFVIRRSTIAGILGLIAGGFLLHLYVNKLPDTARELLNILVTPSLKNTIRISGIVLLLYFIYTYWKPERTNVYQAVLAIVVVFAGIWSAERIREIIRKPYVIHGVMFSNQIIGGEIEKKGVGSEIESLKKKGLLNKFAFVPERLRNPDEKDFLEAGRVIALIKCSSCHVLNERGLRPLPSMIQRLGIEDPESAKDIIDALGSYPYMPPFAGTEAEKEALARFLVSLNKGREK